MNMIVIQILKFTGYRFPKYGVFGRGTRSRQTIEALGIKCVLCNLTADLK